MSILILSNATIYDLWMRDYNRTHTKKLELIGMDFSQMATCADRLTNYMQLSGNESLVPLCQQLLIHSRYQDEVWKGFNKDGFKMDRGKWLTNGVEGYLTIMKIYSALEKMQDKVDTLLSPSQKTDLKLTLKNLEQGFYAIYKPVKVDGADASRDSSMAEMVINLKRLNPEEKIIVLGHNYHLSKESIVDFGGSSVGTFLKKVFPGKYHVTGLMTSYGTYSATKHRFIVNESRFNTYTLDAPKADSWEALFSQQPDPNFYLDRKALEQSKALLKHRFVGYSPSVGREPYAKVELGKIYDAVVFLKNTTAGRNLYRE